MISPVRAVATLKIVAATLVVVVVALCTGDVAHAAMMPGQPSDCSSRACADQIACRAAAQAPALPASHALPAATLPTVDAVVGPEPSDVVTAACRSEVVPLRSVLQLAPRSPPVTA